MEQARCCRGDDALFDQMARRFDPAAPTLSTRERVALYLAAVSVIADTLAHLIAY